MNRIRIIFVVCMAMISATAVPDALHIDDRGAKLKQYYLGLNVENLWIAGQHINWETGQADNPDATHNIKTHCSSFVAAACEKAGIYILRPPQHKQGLLANAQYDWLLTREAADNGWVLVTGNNIYETAQGYANKGYIVAAVCKNPDPHKPGHIALVMPAEISLEKLSESGPRLIMAGSQNYNTVSLREGFRHHLDGWPENSIRFYRNQKKPLP